MVIFEAEAASGGMMRYGIPQYRLPRPTLDADVQRILDMGVELRLNERVDDIQATLHDGGFDACFLGVGSQLSKRAYIPAGDARRITDAVSVLREMEGEDKPLLGRRVVVYGGGNTAIDVARTARRLGAEESVIVYRRTRERMPAHGHGMNYQPRAEKLANANKPTFRIDGVVMHMPGQWQWQFDVQTNLGPHTMLTDLTLN